MERIYGYEYGDVIEHVRCPRCNAPAVIRSRKLDLDSQENHLVCKKCHLVLLVGFVSSEANSTLRKLLELKELRNKARTVREQKRLDAKISELEERMSLYDLVSVNRLTIRVTPIKEDE